MERRWPVAVTTDAGMELLGPRQLRVPAGCRWAVEEDRDDLATALHYRRAAWRREERAEGIQARASRILRWACKQASPGALVMELVDVTCWGKRASTVVVQRRRDGSLWSYGWPTGTTGCRRCRRR